MVARSWIVKPSRPRRSSACRRLTLTSSRKTSLSVLRPTLVESASTRKVDPALGPCLTRRSACPGSSSSAGKGNSSCASPSTSMGLIPRVVSPWREAPHLAQKCASSLLGCPQLVQYTLYVSDPALCARGWGLNPLPRPRRTLETTLRPGEGQPRQERALQRRQRFGSGTGEVLGGGLVDERAIGRGVHEPVGCLGDLQDDEPAVTVGLLVHELGPLLQERVAFQHRARDRGIYVGDGLRGLDLAERLAPRDLRSDLGDVHIYDVAECVLGVVGDPDPNASRRLLAHPLVLLRVAEVFRELHRIAPSGRARGTVARRPVSGRPRPGQVA